MKKVLVLAKVKVKVQFQVHAKIKNKVHKKQMKVQNQAPARLTNIESVRKISRNGFMAQTKVHLSKVLKKQVKVDNQVLGKNQKNQRKIQMIRLMDIQIPCQARSRQVKNQNLKIKFLTIGI